MVVPCIANIVNIFCNDYGFGERIIFSSMNPGIPLAMMAGGFMSRRLGLKTMGTPLLVIGAKQAYHTIVQIVRETKKSAKVSNDHVLVLNNENIYTPSE